MGGGGGQQEEAGQLVAYFARLVDEPREPGALGLEGGELGG